jgi:hypothetical protein
MNKPIITEEKAYPRNPKIPDKNQDIFFREEYTLIVSYPLRSKIMKVLKANFKMRELWVIEEKDETL